MCFVYKVFFYPDSIQNQICCNDMLTYEQKYNQSSKFALKWVDKCLYEILALMRGKILLLEWSDLKLHNLEEKWYEIWNEDMKVCLLWLTSLPCDVQNCKRELV